MSANDFEDKGYLQEKAINTLQEIASVVQDLNRAESVVPREVFQELKDGLRAALHDSTKVVAFLHDSIQKQSWADVDLILVKGQRGLDEALFKYGCRPETDEMIKDRERPQFALKVLQLSKGDVRESRRAIYDECERFGNDPLRAKIENLLEGVTQNTKEWAQFQREIEQILSPYGERAAGT
jgi:hypothetical protein